MTEIVNRVANSSIATINLEEGYPKGERVVFDLKPFLFQELILKERDFRTALKEQSWDNYSNKWVAITCTADAIIPNWAFMLVATYLENVAKGYVIGDLKDLENFISEDFISKIDFEEFENRPVVIKGCSDFPIPMYAYGRLISLVQKHAKSIMYGEPCSTVPLYKRPKG